MAGADRNRTKLNPANSEIEEEQLAGPNRCRDTAGPPWQSSTGLMPTALFGIEMHYKTREFGGSSDFSIQGEVITVGTTRRLGASSSHSFPRSALSSAEGWVEQRDKTVASTVQLAALAAFCVVIFISVRRENSGPLLWIGISLTIGVMVLAAFFGPKTRVFVAYSSGGQPVFAITQNCGIDGKHDFEEFIAEYRRWIGEKEPSQAPDRMPGTNAPREIDHH